MNNNSIAIDLYLQNNMSADERAAFEKQLATDAALQHELQVQQQIMMAAHHAGLKQQFAKAIRGRRLIKKCITWGTVVVIVMAGLVVYYFRSSLFIANTGNKPQQTVNTAVPFINPPMQAINVPFTEYDLLADQGDTIFHATGTVICFQPHALVDAAGNIVSGHVKIMYREFTDPVDFFVSGIPMQYDSAGNRYNFESSGMCEIQAFREGKPVFVNPQAKPQVHLSSKNKSPLHNVYYLDTVTRAWQYRGKDRITELKNTVRRKTVPASTTALETVMDRLPNKPVKPMPASEDHPTFNIQIDPGSFEELFAYDRLRFEVVDEKSYRRSDADEHWDQVKLDRTDVAGIYSITFENNTRKVSYKVRPVLEGADYEAALKVFNEKNKAYEDALKQRLVRYDVYADSIQVISKKLQDTWKEDSAWNARMNELIEARNRNMREMMQRQEDEMKKQMEENVKRIAEQARQMQENEKRITEQILLLKRNQSKYETDRLLSSEIMRSFTLNNFGVWNCDHPQYPYNEISLNVTYTDSTNVSLTLNSVAAVYKGFNGITQFPTASFVRVIPGSENMIWSVTDGWLYYFTYTDFRQSGISKQSRSFVFQMRRSKQRVSTYGEIRQLAEGFE